MSTNPQDISALIARVEEAERLLSGSLDRDFGLWSSPVFNEPRSAAFNAWRELNAALPLLKALHSQTEGEADANSR